MASDDASRTAVPPPAESHRAITIRRTAPGRYTARNARGGELSFGSGGDEAFTPVELLLAAIGGCSGVDVDLLTARRAEPEAFEVAVEADKVRDEEGNHLAGASVVFRVRFPEGPEGDAARAVLPDAVRRSKERLCTVSRTVELPTPVDFAVEG